MASLPVTRIGTVYVNAEGAGVSARLSTAKGGVTLGGDVLSLLKPLKDIAAQTVQSNGKPSWAFPHVRVIGAYDEATEVLNVTSVERATVLVADTNGLEAFKADMAGVPARQPRAATPAPSAPAPDADSEPRF